MKAQASTVMRAVAPWIGLVLLSGLTYDLRGQYPNVRVSYPGHNTPEEVTIAINPLDSNNLVAGANITYYYYSTDGGQTWFQSNLSSTMGVWGDPVVTFDDSGHAYYSHLSNPQDGSWLDRIVVQKSTDGGANWSDGAGIGLNPPKDQDKEWLAVDATGSPYHGNIYMAWTEFDYYGSSNPLDSTRILLSRSTDRGVNWMAPVRISTRGGDCIDEDNTVEGAVPAVGPNGEVYLSWSGPLGIHFDKSTDGGVTFGEDVFVTSQPGGWDFSVSGIYRCNGLPMTACDVSHSPYRGTIYILWSDQRNGHTDVFLIKSTDEGQTWGPVRRVNDDATSRHQFFPSMAIDQTTGHLFVTFYDRRNTGGDTTEVWMARSVDGGETFTNLRISDTPFKPIGGIFFGDYVHVAAHNRHIHPIWMRMDGSLLSVWTCSVYDTSTATDVCSPLAVRGFELRQNYPNPFNHATTIDYQLGMNTEVVLRIYNALGQEVRMLVDRTEGPGLKSVAWDGRDDRGRPVASGVYVYRLRAGNQLQSRKLLLLK